MRYFKIGHKCGFENFKHGARKIFNLKTTEKFPEKHLRKTTANKVVANGFTHLSLKGREPADAVVSSLYYFFPHLCNIHLINRVRNSGFFGGFEFDLFQCRSSFFLHGGCKRKTRDLA